jgi:hypothetical protein
MKLKSKNSNPFIFLTALVLLTVLLLSLKGINKTSKYVATPVFEQKTSLDLIQITLKEKHYNKLKKKRNKALSVGVLETDDNDYVPATITFNGVDYKAQIRLKGDWTDHLAGDKWSFRVKLKDDKTILGMRKFSVHHPKTRGYINEWLYQKAIKKENLIGLRYGFLEGAIHIKKENTSKYLNKAVGIYAIEETFDKRTIENNKRKESIILKFSENYWWHEVKKSLKVGSPYGLDWNTFMQRVDYPITLFSESKMLQDTVMRSYFKLSKNLLRETRFGKMKLSDAFDVKKLAMQNAILNLFGATHGNYIINLRFYYNPITSKLEPIAFDGNSGGKLKGYIPFNLVRQKKDSIYEKELIKALKKVSKEDYLNELISENKNEITSFQKTLKTEFKTNLIALDNIKQNQEIIKKELLRLQKKYNYKNINEEITLDNTILNNIDKVVLPEFSNWKRVNVNFVKSTLMLNNETAYKLTRKTTSKPAYVAIDNINTANGGYYKMSVIVKKGIKDHYFGLRLQGAYPSRVDAVFNLDKGQVKDVKNVMGFQDEKASIESLGNGWYRCSLSGLVNTEKVRIIFGSTSKTRTTLSWEASTKNKNDIFIIPQSLMVEEIETQNF